jgi:hypothetical protein
MGSAATEASVSGFLNKSQPEWRTAMTSEFFYDSIETIDPESSPFDISVMNPPGGCFAALHGFVASLSRFA